MNNPNLNKYNKKLKSVQKRYDDNYCLPNADYSQIKDKICHSIDCSNNWKVSQKKIINGTETCIDSCDLSDQYINEYNGKCLQICPNGTLTDNNGNTIKKINKK